MQKNSKKNTFIVSEESAGLRIDNFLSDKIPGKSRSYLQKLIVGSFVKVNDRSVSKNCKLNTGDIVEFTDRDFSEHDFSGNIKPQKIPLKILYEDDYYLIISKDAGISVHPSPGRYENTLVNALLFYFKNHHKNFPYIVDNINIMESMGSANNGVRGDAGILDITNNEHSRKNVTEDVYSGAARDIAKKDIANINSGSIRGITGGRDGTQRLNGMRPGIIHRLDKDTSGIIIVAKDSSSQYRMAELFKNRQVEKTYLALVTGCFSEKKGTIALPIGRSRIDRKKMAVSIDSGRSAVTDFEIIEDFRECTLLSAYPKTGRTHQIRVHFSYIDHPIISDMTYGNSESTRIGNSLDLNRQFLHAQKLSFYHPITNKKVEIEDEPAEDLKKSLEKLRQH
jgi:23S rRNA-/tRNA-specific pseudouridylate synthase